ncbi:MAG: TRAP transporter small permease [Deltaproteobacteria bacterium]|jgi:C4-dicarboxylate transporter DctQ subunit|nr:TRAP transporter small permease [Deltaproteobacteria bacterium]
MTKFQNIVDKSETYAVTITLSLMTIVVFVQVFLRTLGGLETFCTTHQIELTSIRALTGMIYRASITVLSWSEELARYLMVWTVFIGGAIGAKTGAHVGLEAFINLFPPKLTKFALLLSGIISMTFCLFLTAYGSYLVRRIIKTNQASPALEIPMGLVYAAVPIGAILMSCHFLFAGIDKYRNYKGKAPNLPVNISKEAE